MYLRPADVPVRNNTKWNSGLAAFRIRAGLDGIWPKTKKLRAGLGQDSTDIDYATGLPCDDPRANCGVAAPPSQPGVNPSTQAAYKNLLTQQQSSKDPLDYISPQAAIAAGLDAQTVYNAWSKGLQKFPTQNAALQAGVPAGVVTQLWSQSRAALPAVTSWLNQSPLGFPNLWLIAGGLGIVMLAGGRRGRR